MWHTSLGTPFTTASADGTQNMVFGCADIFPVIGINSTPVIDTTTNTLYVLAKTQDTSGNAHQTIHAIDLTTGTDKMPGVEIVASVPAGTGASGATGTTLAFDPKNELPRPALLLYNGTIYIAWAGHCDVTPWHGWVIAYDAATLTQKGAYATTPNGNAGGIWQSGIGLSADDTGVYFVSGNGTFDANGANGNAMNKGLSVGRLTLSATGLTQVDSYTPSTATNLDTNDEDLTTGAIIGPNNNYLYMAGKDSTLRVLNRANLGGFNAAGDKVVQEFGLGGGHVHGGPTFFNGPTPTLFTWCEGCNLSGYTVMAGGMLNTTAATGNIGYQPVHPGAIVTVSSNGQTPNTGVVWASTLTKAASSTGYDAAWHHIVAGELYAFDASNLGKGPIWNSEANAADSLGLFGKFSTPTVANGKVYLGTSTTTNAVRVYGLKP